MALMLFVGTSMAVIVVKAPRLTTSNRRLPSWLIAVTVVAAPHIDVESRKSSPLSVIYRSPVLGWRRT